MGDNVFFSFLREYWDEIVALFDKIYFAFKEYVQSAE